MFLANIPTKADIRILGLVLKLVNLLPKNLLRSQTANFRVGPSYIVIAYVWKDSNYLKANRIQRKWIFMNQDRKKQYLDLKNSLVIPLSDWMSVNGKLCRNCDYVTGDVYTPLPIHYELKGSRVAWESCHRTGWSNPLFTTYSPSRCLPLLPAPPRLLC